MIDGIPEDDVALLIAVLPICCKRRTTRDPAITRYSIHMHTLRSCDGLPRCFLSVRRRAFADVGSGREGIAEPLYGCAWSP